MPVTTPRKNGTPNSKSNVVTPGSRTTRQKNLVVEASPSVRKTQTPMTATKPTAATVVEAKPVAGIPDFIMPLVRAMCKATRSPKASPHVVVGAGAVAKEIASRTIKRGLDKEPATKRRRTRTPQKEVAVVEDAGDAVAVAKWPALAIALHTFTVARMRGVETDSEEMVEVQEQARDAVEQYCIQNAAILPKELETITAESLKKPLDFYMLEAEDCGWLDMDWYRNVPENIHDEDDEPLDDGDVDVDMEDEDEGPVTPRKRPSKTPLRRKEKHGGKAALAFEGLFEDDLGAAGLLPGLGTMFQPAIDWLSDERRADYAKWKKSILKECAAIEAKA